MINYTHTQHVPPEAMVAISAVIGLSAILVPGRLLKGLTALGLGGLAYTFSSMTITIDPECIQIKYGDWLTVKRLALTDIVAYQPARMNPANGWGIHFVGAGWLYNIYGLDAVEVTLSSGEKFYIGTDEPEALRDAIAYARMPVA
jgi:hypothetical protein